MFLGVEGLLILQSWETHQILPPLTVFTLPPATVLFTSRDNPDKQMRRARPLATRWIYCSLLETVTHTAAISVIVRSLCAALRSLAVLKGSVEASGEGLRLGSAKMPLRERPAAVVVLIKFFKEDFLDPEFAQWEINGIIKHLAIETELINPEELVSSP